MYYIEFIEVGLEESTVNYIADCQLKELPTFLILKLLNALFFTFAAKIFFFNKMLKHQTLCLFRYLTTSQPAHLFFQNDVLYSENPKLPYKIVVYRNQAKIRV
jgi:hypothetical protein